MPTSRGGVRTGLEIPLELPPMPDFDSDQSGYLYTLSNGYLEPDLLKIGFTTRKPEERARSLSRSTAIPGAFHVESSVPVNDCKLAERRLHLLLSKQRVDQNKEFFRVSVRSAESLCLAIRTFEEEEKPVSDALLVHRDFYFTRVTPRPPLSVLKALMYVLCATQHNSIVDHLLTDRLLIVDGFASAKAFAQFRNSHVRSASAALRSLAATAEDLTYLFPGESEPIRLFAKFVYERGHAAWAFQPEFRRLFMIPTTA